MCSFRMSPSPHILHISSTVSVCRCGRAKTPHCGSASEMKEIPGLWPSPTILLSIKDTLGPRRKGHPIDVQ